MPAAQPTAVWLNVARSSARTKATRRRLIRQFEYLDVAGNPDVVGLADVASTAVPLWRDWAGARGYHVVPGRLVDRLPITALLLTRAERTVASSARAASTPRRTTRGLTSWLEMQSVLVEDERGGLVRVANARCHGSHRTALNYLRSCLDGTAVIVGGSFDLTVPSRADSQRTPLQRNEIRWVAAHTPFRSVAAARGDRVTVDRADTLAPLFADASTASNLHVRSLEFSDADGLLSDRPAIVVDRIAPAASPPTDGMTPTQVSRRSTRPSHPNRLPRPCAR